MESVCPVSTVASGFTAACSMPAHREALRESCNDTTNSNAEICPWTILFLNCYGAGSEKPNFSKPTLHTAMTSFSDITVDEIKEQLEKRGISVRSNCLF